MRSLMEYYQDLEAAHTECCPKFPNKFYNRALNEFLSKEIHEFFSYLLIRHKVDVQYF